MGINVCKQDLGPVNSNIIMFEIKNILRVSFIIFGLAIVYQGIKGIEQKFSLIEDPNNKVRTDRKAELESVMSTVVAHLDSDLKSQIENKLLSVIEKSSQEEKYKLIRFLSLLDSNKGNHTDNGNLDNYFIEILKSPSQESLFSVSLNHLAKKKHKWLYLNIHIYLSHSSEFVRFIALNALLDLCSTSAISSLDSFLSMEKNLQLINFAKKIKRELEICTTTHF